MTLLLARLACFPDHPQPRDVLAEELWPDDESHTLRERFRQTLALVRRVLEPTGVAPGSVLMADRSTVRLAPGAFSTDVADFEAAFRAGSRSESSPASCEKLRKAVSFYGGELLPGFYDDWVLTRRRHLADQYRQTLSRLAETLAASEQFDAAVETARQAVQADPLREESHGALIRLLARVGQTLAAQRHYDEWRCLLREKLQAEPSAETQRLMEQVRSGVLTVAAAPASARSAVALVPPAHTLPVPMTRFFGREPEITLLESLLAPDDRSPALPPRLVTVTGLGGAGKTRLALELAHRLFAKFGEAVWFVPLADVTYPSLIPDVVHEALGIARSPQATPWEQLADFLKPYPAVLLVLDNFEHLQDGGASVVQTLRQRLPHVTCLITSRCRLGVDGERDLALPPLTTPDTLKTPEALLQYASIQLFLDRAQAARYSFRLTPDNADAVTQLGQCLEGLPLAIELAAAWAATLTPEQILLRLSRRFEVLVSRRSDVVERHRSLQAVLEGSYQLLPPKLQQLYARLSVFRGGWTYDAAEKIAADGSLNPDALALLHERSFIQAEERGAEMRYRLLESLREFGAELLEAEEQASLARRHAAYFLGLVEEAQTHLRTPGEKQAFDRLESEQDNLRAALEWAVEAEAETALRMAALLGSFWMTRGYTKEGSDWLERALARSDAMSPARADALNGLALMHLSQGDYGEGEKRARQSLAAQRCFDNKQGVAKALNTLGAIVMEQGSYGEARACYEECLDLYRETGYRMGESIVLANLGNLFYGQGEYALACDCYNACLETRREMGDQRGIAAALDYLARAVREQGDYSRACELHHESLAMRRALGDKYGVAFALSHLGRIQTHLGEHDEARLLLQESLLSWREIGDKAGLAEALSQLGELSRRANDMAAARLYWSESLQIVRETGDLPSLAGLLEAFAGIKTADSHARGAAQLLGKAACLRTETASPIQPTTRVYYEQIVAGARAVLGPERFQQAWDEGAALTNEQAIRLTK